MKYAVIVLVVLLVWWLLLRPRLRKPREPRARRRGKAEAIVNCAHCGLHLPQTEALHSRGSYYCDEAHRLAAERRNGS